MTGSYDSELNLLYWGVGNAAADFYGEARRGTNLYTDSIIALDPDTGKLKWYYQEIPHDMWDFDAAFECVLLDDEWRIHFCLARGRQHQLDPRCGCEGEPGRPQRTGGG